MVTTLRARLQECINRLEKYIRALEQHTDMEYTFVCKGIMSMAPPTALRKSTKMSVKLSRPLAGFNALTGPWILHTAKVWVRNRPSADF